MLTEPLAVMILVIDAFDNLGVQYLIGASLASALHGTARSTLDIDLVADLHSEQVMPLVEALQKDFYIDDRMITDAIQRQSSFNLIHLATLFKVDVFIPKHRPFEQVQFQRRQLQLVANDPERKAYVTTPEDIILAKLEWYRLGGEVSDHQWSDIQGVLKVQAGRLDLNYLRQWAAELGVTDLLEKALQEARI